MHSTSSTSNKSLLVFAAAPGRLGEFQRYLQNREWEIRMRADLKLLLADVMEIKPTYVLLSDQARHPDLNRVESLLSQIYQVKVIRFSEEATEYGPDRIVPRGEGNHYLGALTGPRFEAYLGAQMQRNSVSLAPLKRGISEMMKALFSLENKRITEPLTWTSRMACFHVCAGPLKGIFLAAMGGDRILDPHTSERVEMAIRDILESQGLKVDSLETFPIDSRRVEFKAWADKAAHFMESGGHRGVEIALAFFETNINPADIPVSEDGQYLQLDLNQIKPDRPVNFDLYLSLPMNGRYVLYVAAGSSLSFTQQLNLQSRRVENLFAKALDRTAVARDLLTAEVDRSLGEFYEQKEQMVA